MVSTTSTIYRYCICVDLVQIEQTKLPYEYNYMAKLLFSLLHNCIHMHSFLVYILANSSECDSSNRVDRDLQQSPECEGMA